MDDVNFSGCPYLEATDNYRYSHNETFETWSEEILPVIRIPVCTSFGLTEE